jgi:membrane-bound lytic murein transglycosylase D
MTVLRRLVSLLVTLTLTACGTLPTAEPPTATPQDRAPSRPVTTGVGTPVSPISEPSTLGSGPVGAVTDGGRTRGTANAPSAEPVAVAPVPSVQPVAPVVAPTDLWQRMENGFAMPDLDDERVAHWERWYASRPDYLQRMADRASKYLFHIVEEIERRDLPLELALLPFIESAFNPQAVSHAKAAGMWQFMPATGKHFDLKQNAFRDDRRDVLASTRAALDYLEGLYRMFGDWHLALAAYNWGEGNVQRAIRRNQAAGLPTGYLDLRMPDETRHYVPKLQAMKNLVRARGQRHVALPTIGNHPFFDTVRIERDIDVALIARLADVSEADFHTLNPAHNKPVIMAAGTPEILLPWDNALRFTERLARHQGPLASWTAWRVPRDMSPAQAAQQVGWDEAALRQANRIPPRMRLKAGSTILVPREGKLDRDVPEQLADHGQLMLAPDRPATRTVRIQARKGDTITSLAQRHRVRPADLVAWNGLAPNARLRAGQTLDIQVPVARPATRNATARASDKARRTQAKAPAQARPPATRVARVPQKSRSN